MNVPKLGGKFAHLVIIYGLIYGLLLTMSGCSIVLNIYPDRGPATVELGQAALATSSPTVVAPPPVTTPITTTAALSATSTVVVTALVTQTELALEVESLSPSTQAASAADEVALAHLGMENGLAQHLRDGDEYSLPLATLLQQGETLFTTVWTTADGAGRPFSNGMGGGLANDARPLAFPRNFNRISGPDANSCAACHNRPYNIPGGGGDIVANVFVLAQRFDFATFDQESLMPLEEGKDELGKPVTLQTIGNSRATTGLFGAGYLEMLARQMTTELQTIRDTIQPNELRPLSVKGIAFGMLQRRADGAWDTSLVEGIPAQSLITTGPNDPPSLIIRPFHQSGSVVSLRQFTNNGFNQHHGIQSTERFGVDIDEDGDGVINELTRADVTAVTLFQATMAVPGRVIPRNPVIEAAVWTGEQRFDRIGCTSCHVAQLPLDNEGWIFTEPNPYNPAKNLRVGDASILRVDLTSDELPQPRLHSIGGVVYVPAYTDLKLHNITAEEYDPNVEPLDMNQPLNSNEFFLGNRYFLTKRLWGAANEPPYFHHGLYTTLRDAILAHDGEAHTTRLAYEALSDYEQRAVIEFLKSLQVLPPGTPSLIIDEAGNPRTWPPTQ
ncbi:MAG: di-heme oxidoredictase family protein [Caldilineaceae bacterium]